MEYDDVVKVAIVGSEGVGKTCLAQRFAQGTYHEEAPPPTVGADFLLRTLQVDGLNTRIHIWDTAGAQRYRQICCSYYRQAHVVLLCYDASRPASLADVTGWLAEVRTYAPAGVRPCSSAASPTPPSSRAAPAPSRRSSAWPSREAARLRRAKASRSPSPSWCARRGARDAGPPPPPGPPLARATRRSWPRGMCSGARTARRPHARRRACAPPESLIECRPRSRRGQRRAAATRRSRRLAACRAGASAAACDGSTAAGSSAPRRCRRCRGRPRRRASSRRRRAARSRPRGSACESVPVDRYLDCLGTRRCEQPAIAAACAEQVDASRLWGCIQKLPVLLYNARFGLRLALLVTTRGYGRGA